MNLSDYVKVYKNALNLNICNDLIEQFESDVEHQVRRQEGPYNFTEINVVAADWYLEPIYAPMIEYRKRYWSDCGITVQHVNPEHEWEQIRMKRYEAGTDQQFHPHTDAWDRNTAQRFLVFFWYLNTVDAGGETEFYGLDQPIKIKPEAGTLIMFPATWQYLHAGLPALNTDKYIVGGYFHHG